MTRQRQDQGKAVEGQVKGRRNNGQGKWAAKRQQKGSEKAAKGQGKAATRAVKPSSDLAVPLEHVRQLFEQRLRDNRIPTTGKHHKGEAGRLSWSKTAGETARDGHPDNRIAARVSPGRERQALQR